MCIYAHTKLFMRVPPSQKKKPKNIPLSEKTLTLLSAYGEFKKSLGDQEPSRAWMVERGANLFLEMVADQHPKFREIKEDFEEQFEKRDQIARERGLGGRGLVRTLVPKKQKN